MHSFIKSSNFESLLDTTWPFGMPLGNNTTMCSMREFLHYLENGALTQRLSFNKAHEATIDRYQPWHLLCSSCVEIVRKWEQERGKKRKWGREEIKYPTSSQQAPLPLPSPLIPSLPLFCVLLEAVFHFQALSGYWAINGLSARQATRPNRPDMLEVEAREGVEMEET